MHQEFIDQLIEKNPQLKESQQKLAALAPGSYCFHRSWGFGKIQGYNASENKLVIDFEGRPSHGMDPAFCIDKLDILQANSILVRKHTEPELIQRMIEHDPVELVSQVLSECPDRAASPIELEATLGRLMDPASFKRWWTATKKLLAKADRIACPQKKTESYVLRDEPVHPDSQKVQEFFETRRAKEKITRGQELLELAQTVDEATERLPEVLQIIKDALYNAHNLTEAERLQGLWLRDDIATKLGEDVSLFDPKTAAFVERISNLSEVVQELSAAQIKRLLTLLEAQYPESWQTKTITILRNSSGKVIQECIHFLTEKHEEALLGRTLEQWMEEQTLRGPLMLWILKNRTSKRYAPFLEPLMGPKLLSAALYAVDYEALQSSSSKRIALAELISEDTALISDLLKGVSFEIARDLAQSLLLSQGFEPLTKKSLLARFIKLFPAIQSLVAGEAQGEVERLIVSRKSYELRKLELEDLIMHKIPENKRMIATAREHGDLRENSEYKMGRQDQEILMARKAQLESDLARAAITDFSDAPADKVGIGSVVEVSLEGSKKSTVYTILGAWDSEPDSNILSYKTPLAQALLGKTIGESATTSINGQTQTWTIVSIKPYAD